LNYQLSVNLIAKSNIMKTVIKLGILGLLSLSVATPAMADQGDITKWLQSPANMMGENIGSDVDWRDIMQPIPTAPNWVVADDFRSDGRPIYTVRWWGSYFDPANQPECSSPTDCLPPFIEDGFILSFFSDQPVEPPDNPFSRPKDLLGSYIAPIEAVRITPTGLIGWDQHPIWQYEVNLQDTHLDHPSPIADPIKFNEQAGEIYWLSIAAQNGHDILPDWSFLDNGDPVEPEHFWGWHTSPDSFGDVATMGSLIMPNTDWVYQDWDLIEPLHTDNNMAFELLTTPEPSSTLSFLALGTIGAGVALKRKQKQK
jgi:hypothetical protein